MIKTSQRFRNTSIILGLLLAFSLVYSHAQKLYDWTDHLSCNDAIGIAVNETNVYCITEGGMFSVFKDSRSIEKLSTINGLSDIGFSSIGSSEDFNIIFLGYINGNLDLLSGTKVTNLSDIKRKTIAGSKQINNFYFEGDYAYVSTGFGIVVIDIPRTEVKETYFIGENGGIVNVQDFVSDDQYFYAATSEGIYIASKQSENLIDHNSWQKLSNLPDAEGNYTAIEFYNSTIFTVLNRVDSDDEIFSISTNSYNSVLGISGDVTNMHAVDNGLWVANRSQLVLYSETGSEIQKIDNSIYYKPRPSDMAFSDNEIWVADYGQGAIQFDEGLRKHFYLPKGPRYSKVTDIASVNDKIWVAAGGPTTVWSGYGGYSYQNEQWINFNRVLDGNLTNIPNFYRIAIDPKDENHVFYSSVGYGVIEYRNNEFVAHYDESNSVLNPVDGFSYAYTRVMGLDFDTDGTLWAATTQSSSLITYKPSGGDFVTVDLKQEFSFETLINTLYVDSKNRKWLSIHGVGLLVFNHGPGVIDPQEKLLPVINRDGESISNKVYAIAEDKNGNIWIGTDAGPAVYYSPDRVFDGGTIYASRVLIPRNNGTNNADILLEKAKINCIYIDGADRKWFGTKASGAFLMSKDGTKEIRGFNTENSPIFSNYIYSIAINEENGQVFFGTDKGIIAYKGNASEANDYFKDVYVYPNPVRETYYGDIVIAGMVKDANVKITDVSGNLVFETTSLGGQAVWDGNTLQGERAATGVYLVFCASPDGTQSFVTKLLFIN